MLKMSDASRRFLRAHLPELLSSTDVNEALDTLYDWIDLHGFRPDGLYNETGRKAQAVYDDLYFNNG